MRAKASAEAALQGAVKGSSRLWLLHRKMEMMDDGSFMNGCAFNTTCVRKTRARARRLSRRGATASSHSRAELPTREEHLYRLGVVKDGLHAAERFSSLRLTGRMGQDNRRSVWSNRSDSSRIAPYYVLGCARSLGSSAHLAWGEH